MGIKKVIAVFLSVVLCMVASCGATENGEGKEAGSEAQKNESSEYGYQFTFQDVEGVEGKFHQAELIGDAVYFTTATDYYGQEAGRRLYQLKGGAVTEVPLEEFGEIHKIEAISKDGEGNLKLVITSGDETVICELRTVSIEGKTISSQDITSYFSEGLSEGIYKMTTDREGNVFIVNGNGLKVIDNTGGLSFAVPEIRPMDIACSTEGKVFLIYIGNTGTQLKEVDMQEKTLVDAVDGIEIDRTGKLIQDMQENLRYYAGNAVYEYNKEKRSRELFPLLGNSVNPRHIAVIIQRPEGGFLILTTEVENDAAQTEFGSSQMVEVKQVAAAELPEKVEIVFGTHWMDPAMAREVVDFNKKSDKYRIEIKEYVNDNFDFKAAKNQLNMDIITNKGPDMIDLTGIYSVDMYMEKGLLEDLVPWMEQDEEIANQKYLEHIMDVYRKDGKLYGIIPTFNIISLVGKESIVGNGSTWKLKDMMTLAESTKEDQSLFTKNITKNNLILQICLPANMDSFLNWETGECKFNSEEFIEILEFANACGSAEEEARQQDWSIRDEEYRNEKRLLSMACIGNAFDIKYYEGLFGEEAVNFIGYPVNEGSGARIAPGKALGIAASAQAEKKEGAWQFIRQYLLKDYQENLGPIDGFPVMEEALLNHYEKAMTPEYQEDADGNQVEKPKVTEIILDEPYDIYAIPQEDVDKIDSLIRELDSLIKEEGQINTIIEEEASAYFNGAKTAQEAAEIIQSRVQTYVNENK